MLSRCGSRLPFFGFPFSLSAGTFELRGWHGFDVVSQCMGTPEILAGLSGALGQDGLHPVDVVFTS